MPQQDTRAKCVKAELQQPDRQAGIDPHFDFDDFDDFLICAAALI
jgi:hypothetical protein